MSDTKQKLIDLVSALEEENIIDYCYTFIGLKVYGKTRLPESITADLRQMWEKYLVSCGYMKDEELEPEPERSTHIPDERKETIAELLKEIEGIHNIAKIRFILSIVKNYKKGGVVA